jgi:hypothetical protein
MVGLRSWEDQEIDLIENGVEPPRRVIMDTELVVRDSCGASWKKDTHPDRKRS